jgi:hypothetical protein
MGIRLLDKWVLLEGKRNKAGILLETRTCRTALSQIQIV